MAATAVVYTVTNDGPSIANAINVNSRPGDSIALVSKGASNKVEVIMYST